MKVNLVAYGIAGLMAIAAGGALAGLPSESADTPIVDPDAVTTTSTTIPVVTAAPIPPAPAPIVATSDTASELNEPATSPTATISDAVTPASAPIATAQAAEVPIVERSAISLAVINATDVVGIASDRAASLELLGYTQASTGDTIPTQTTTVYAASGFEREAARLLEDIEIGGTAILPIQLAPEITATGEFQLMLVLGLDSLT